MPGHPANIVRARSRSRRFLYNRCWILAIRSGRIHQAVLAALDARMIFVAGDQQDSVGVTVGERPVSGDLATVADEG
jgi:hypothetical protein